MLSPFAGSLFPPSYWTGITLNKTLALQDATENTQPKAGGRRRSGLSGVGLCGMGTVSHHDTVFHGTQIDL